MVTPEGSWMGNSRRLSRDDLICSTEMNRSHFKWKYNPEPGNGSVTNRFEAQDAAVIKSLIWERRQSSLTVRVQPNTLTWTAQTTIKPSC